MKKFLLGVIITLAVEAIIFGYKTCNVQVTTKYSYNPQAILSMVPEATTYTTTK